MIKELSIFIIEDQPSDVILMDHALRESGLSFHSRRIDTLEQFIHELKHHPPDLILSDHGVPGFDGFAALETAQKLCPKIPFIFVTGANGDETAVETLKRGAIDYVLKNNLGRLGESVQKALHSKAYPLIPPKPAEGPAPAKFEAEAGKTAELTQPADTDLRELLLFLKIMTSEFRPPTQHVEKFSQLLLKSDHGDLKPKVVSHLRTISESAGKLSNLLDTMEKFVRVGHEPMNKLCFDLGEIVQEIIREMRPVTDGREIEWIIGKLPQVVGDPVMLSMAVTELIANAIKFSGDQKKTVIEIGGGLEKGEVVVFIADNGIGFDQEKAEDAFKVFTRLKGSESFPGIGMGLANVRRIIQRHGGRVWADATKGEGARITVSLPQADPSANLSQISIKQQKP